MVGGRKKVDFTRGFSVIEQLNEVRGKAGLAPLEVTSPRRGGSSQPPQEVVALEVIAPVPRVITPERLAQSVLNIEESLKHQESEGEVNTVNLVLTSEIQEEEFRHPITRYVKPLQTISIFNDGPDPGYFKVNYPASGAIYLKKGETTNLDFTKAKRKIHRLYYYCGPGSVATSRAVGKF